MAERTRVGLLELRSRVPLPVDLPVSHRKLTVGLDMPPEPGALWSSLPAKLRSQVKRPRKEGVEVRFGADQLEPLHHVFAHHMRDLGTPAQSKEFFQAIAEVFPQDVHFAVAYHQDQPNRLRVRVSLERRTRDHLGFGAALAQGNVPEHAGVSDTLSGSRRLCAGDSRLATIACPRWQSDRAARRSVHSVIGRRQLPVASPISAAALGRSLFDSLRAGVTAQEWIQWHARELGRPSSDRDALC